jgi:hypothetical protein
VILALAGVLLAAGVAHADVSADAAAKAAALFATGRTQIEANQVDQACETFEQSLHLDPQIGTTLNLADCRERQGRLDVAYGLFVAAAEEGERTGKEGRATFARQHVDSLAPKIVRVTIRVAAPAPGLEIKLGGVVVPRAAWARPHAAMPGRIAIDARAPGRQLTTVSRNAAAGAEIAIEVPALEAVTQVTPPPPPPAATTEPTPTPTPPVPASASRSKVPYIVGGVGVGLFAGSLGIGLHAKSRYDTAVKNGDRPGVSSAQHEADVGTGFAIAGAIAATVGVVLYFRRGEDSIVVAPAADGGAVGAIVTGRF